MRAIGLLFTLAAACDSAASASAPAPADAGPSCDADVAFVRFSAESPDAPPLDVCLAGDVVRFAKTAPLLDAGLAFGQTSAYVAVPRANAFVRLIVAADASGARDCATWIGPVFGGPVLAADGGAFTVAATGALDRDAGASPLFIAVRVDHAPPREAAICDR